MIQISAVKDVYSQQQLISENFGEEINHKEKMEKDYQDYQIKYFDDKMKDY